MTYSRIVIIYNPNSTGPSQEMAEGLQRDLKDYPATVELHASERRGHAEELAEEAARGGGNPLVISCSGDGGYHEVINGVMKANAAGHSAAAAVLPGGNGNDHRRAIAKGPLLDGIKLGRIAKIDLLKVSVTPPNGQVWRRYAHAYMGLGFTPAVAIELNQYDLNPFIEIFIAAKALSQLQPVTIRTEGAPLTLDSLILANIKETGKTLTLTETGGPADGQFEVIAHASTSKFRLFAHLAKGALLGLKPDRKMSHYEFETTELTPVQIDGEVSELEPGTLVHVVSATKILETVL